MKAMAATASPTARAISTLPQLRRLLWAVGRLRSGRPLKAHDLAAEFEVNVRTAYRSLDFLRDDWRVPLEFDRAQGTYRLTEPTVALPLVTMSEGRASPCTSPRRCSRSTATATSRPTS